MIIKNITYKSTYRNILLCIILIHSNSTFFVNAQIAAYSNEFLNIGIDAASLSKGSAVIADIQGVCAGYWNPAGLSNLETSFETSLMHANYFSGMAQFDYFGIAYKPANSLSLGFSLIRFGIDDIPNTLNLIDADGNVNYDQITYFSVADYAFLFSLAKKSKINGLNWGINLKLIYRKQGEFATAYGFGFDIGAGYSVNKWKFGAVLRDASSTFNIWIFNLKSFEEAYLATGNEIPENSLELSLPKLLLGVAHQFNFNNKISLITELDLDCFFDGQRHSLISSKSVNIDPHFGLQISYLKNIHLRAGIDRMQLAEDFEKNNKFMFKTSFGIGFYLYRFSLDYALTDMGDISVAPISHIFSIKYAFGK